MSKEAMKLALEALDIVNPREFAQADPDGKIDKAITALRLEIDALNMASTAAKPDFWEGYVPEPVKPATEESSATQAQQALDKKAENAREWGLDYEPMRQEPVAHAVIAGALFDFMGWLTSRKERLVLSSADNASPAVEAITEFAKMRGLSLNDAKVQDWNTSPPAQRTWVGLVWGELPEDGQNHDFLRGAVWAETKLKEKNQ